MHLGFGTISNNVLVIQRIDYETHSLPEKTHPCPR